MYRLRTLGTFGVVDGEGTDVALAPQRLALLALIAAAGERGIARDKVVAVLWPESTPAKARASLEQMLHALRVALDNRGLFLGNPLRLDSAVLTSDVSEFRAAIDQGDAGRAAELYAGPFLDGFYLARSPEFEEWLDRERAALAGQHRAALEQLAAAAGAAGNAAVEAQHLRTLAQAAPLDEAVARRLITALHARGDRAGALEYASEFALRLRAALGVAPDQSFTDLVAAIRSGASRSSAADPVLPAEPEPVAAPGATPPPAPPPRRTRSLWLVTGAAAALALLAALAWSWQQRPARPLHFDVSLGTLSPSFPEIAISPDGSLLAVAGRQRGQHGIYVRRIDATVDFHMIPGTEEGVLPSFSPDSRWIAFRRRSTHELLKVALDGTGLTTLVPPGDLEPFSPHWGTDGDIIFTANRAGYRIAATGGVPKQLPRLGLPTHFLLPDGSGVLTTRPDMELALYEFAGDSLFPLGVRGRHPTLWNDGYLLYVNESKGLAAVRFDRKRRRLLGKPVTLAPRVGMTSLARGYAVSRNGTLVLNDGPASGLAGAPPNVLLHVQLAGGVDTLRMPDGRRRSLRFSPDGRRLAFEIARPRSNSWDVHSVDLVTGADTRHMQDAYGPIWSPDGTRLLFGARLHGNMGDIYQAWVDSSGPPRRALARDGLQGPLAWWRDIIVIGDRQRSDDLMLWSPPDTTLRPYLASPWRENDIALSPDGRLAAYISTEGGRDEVWLADFPAPHRKVRLALNGTASAPRWSPDGRFVYFAFQGEEATQDTIFRVAVQRAPSLAFGDRSAVFTGRLDWLWSWDLHPDGRSLVVAVVQKADPARDAPSRFVLTLNWGDALRRRLAARQR